MTKIILAKLENIATLHVTFTTFYLTSFSGMLWRARLFSSRSWLRGRNGLGRKRPAAFYGREEAARLFGHVQREERRQPLMVWEESSRRPFPYAHERRKYKGTGPVQERKFRHMIYSDLARRISAETLFTYGSGFFIITSLSMCHVVALTLDHRVRQLQFSSLLLQLLRQSRKLISYVLEEMHFLIHTRANNFAHNYFIVLKTDMGVP